MGSVGLFDFLGGFGGEREEVIVVIALVRRVAPWHEPELGEGVEGDVGVNGILQRQDRLRRRTNFRFREGVRSRVDVRTRVRGDAWTEGCVLLHMGLGTAQ